MKIAIIGAGYIGLYLGARLIEAGAEVVFVGRQRMRQHIDENGLKINSYIPSPFEVKDFNYVTDYSKMGEVDFALVTAKTTQMDEVLLELAPHLSTHTKVVNLQNGVDNKDIFKKHNLTSSLVEGMVMFNVVINSSGELFQAASGPVIIDASAGEKLISVLKKAKFEFKATDNIEGYKWSKLLLNLNNSVNAVAGIPIKAELEQRAYRMVLAKLIEEAVQVSKAKKIKLENLTSVPPALIPFILRLPTSVFKIVAKKMVNIDPLAKASMLVDMERNSPTEIDYLNAKVVENAKKLGLTAPANEKMVAIIKAAEAKCQGSPAISAKELARLVLFL